MQNVPSNEAVAWTTGGGLSPSSGVGNVATITSTGQLTTWIEFTTSSGSVVRKYLKEGPFISEISGPDFLCQTRGTFSVNLSQEQLIIGLLLSSMEASFL